MYVVGIGWNPVFMNSLGIPCNPRSIPGGRALNWWSTQYWEPGLESLRHSLFAPDWDVLCISMYVRSVAATAFKARLHQWTGWAVSTVHVCGAGNSSVSYFCRATFKFPIRRCGQGPSVLQQVLPSAGSHNSVHSIGGAGFYQTDDRRGWQRICSRLITATGNICRMQIADISRQTH